MKRYFLLAILTALLGVGALALAASPASGQSATTGNPGTGNQGVLVKKLDNTTFKNPGKAFQAIRDHNGMNPKQWIGQFSNKHGQSTNVGVWIQVQAGRVTGPYQKAQSPSPDSTQNP